MVLFLVVLLIALGYMWWKWSRTTLTRNCRWRQDRTRGIWHCAFCGAMQEDLAQQPKNCLNAMR